MCLFSLFLEDKKEENKNQKNNSSYTEEELDFYGLNDNEKEEVRKGNQNLWDFEEEDLEDDDYYEDGSDR